MVLHYFCSGKSFEGWPYLTFLHLWVGSLHCCGLPVGYELRLLVLGVSPLFFYGFSSGLSDTCYLNSSLSDGKTVGACLDRNGLRPARYWKTSDNFVYVASEVFH